MSYRMRSFLFAVLALVLAAWAGASWADDRLARPVIDLHAGDFYVEPAAGKAGVLFDPTHDLTVEDVRARLGEFRTIETNHVAFGTAGAVSDRIWLHYRVRNATASDGIWVIDLHENWTGDIAVYRAGPGVPARLLLRFPAEDYSEHLYDGPWIATELDLRAGEIADIYIGYVARNSTDLPVAFATPQRYREVVQRRDTINFTANGAWVALILVALMMGRAIGWPLALSFCAYQVSALILMLIVEGYILTASRIGIELVRFLDTGFYSLTAFFMLLFCQQFFETRRESPAIDRLIRWWQIAFIVVAPVELVLHPHPVFTWMTNPLIAIAVVLYVLTAVKARRRRIIGATPVLIGSLMILLTAILDLVQKLAIGILHSETASEFAHLSFIIEAFLFASAIVYRFLKLRQERDRSLRVELAGTQEKLRLSKALAESQRKFNAARDLAERRRAEMASVSHDLRQPLVSLRKGLASAKGLDRESAADMNTAFDYLERLTHGTIADTMPRDEGAVAGAGAEDGEEVFPISAVLDNVVAMFRHEAGAKGLSLRYHPCAAEVRAEPLALMRIASNLVSNAIKHGKTGGVLIGCRARQGHIVIEVHDTGPGMTASQLAEVMEPYRKGDGSDGSGLGLHLVRTMSLEHGLPFTARSVPGRGSSFRIEVPRA